MELEACKPTDCQSRKAGTIPKVSRVRRCPRCPFYAPSGKCLNPTRRSGRCGDWVYYWRNGKQFRRLWVRPRDPRTPRQLLCRARVGGASKGYSQGLTDSQRAACIAAGAKLRTQPRLFQSGPLTGQQYAVRQQCSTKAAVGASSAGPFAKPLQTQGISASTWEHYRSATIALPWQCRRRTAHPGRIVATWPVQERIPRVIIAPFTPEPGKDAFHRVPDFAQNEWDAVERVPTTFTSSSRAGKSSRNECRRELWRGG